MSEVVTETLQIADGGLVRTGAGSSQLDWTPKAPVLFTFHFEAKTVQFDGLTLRLWQMRRGSVYPTRRRAAANYESIIQAFWTLCWREKSVLKDGIQDVYLLAQLLPLVRSQAANHIFADAAIQRMAYWNQARRDARIELEDQLTRSDRNEMTPEEFRKFAIGILQAESFDEATWDLYRQFETELLEPARAELQHPTRRSPMAIVEACWQRWMQSIGRHKGHEQEKRVMNILSYEVKAALHQCYSAVWFELLHLLAEKHQWTPEEREFHQFWHLEPRDPRRDTPESRFHLFGGHIFALHPGTSAFLETATGQRLMADYLRKPRDLAARNRLLHGLGVSVGQYAHRRNEIAFARTKRGDSLDPTAMSNRGRRMKGFEGQMNNI